MWNTFLELTKNEEWLKAINSLKKRDTDDEYNQQCIKKHLEELKKSIDIQH
jgi:HKD family nuclease